MFLFLSLHVVSPESQPCVLPKHEGKKCLMWTRKRMYKFGLLVPVQQNTGNFNCDLRAVPHTFSACERAEISKTTHINKVEDAPNGLWDQQPNLIRCATAKGLSYYH